MFVNMVFVYDELDKAANGINVNGLEFPCSESCFVIRRQSHIPSSKQRLIIVPQSTLMEQSNKAHHTWILM